MRLLLERECMGWMLWCEENIQKIFLDRIMGWMYNKIYLLIRYFMQYTVFDSNGFEDYKSWLRLDKSKYEKINSLIISIQRDGPLNGIGNPELLKGDYKGNYSRRIDQKNRLIYQFIRNKKTGDCQTIILGCKEHYKGSEHTQKQNYLSMLDLTK